MKISIQSSRSHVDRRGNKSSGGFDQGRISGSRNSSRKYGIDQARTGKKADRTQCLAELEISEQEEWILA